ncbi:MAG: mechanosensitive ion channel [Planktomarina sp.]|nr:mechanosensitive ion channel [Planktomarina sp.]
MISKQFLKLTSLALFFGLFIWAQVGTLQAQQGNTALDYNDWDATAEMVEEALLDGTVSELFLITLRDEIAERRAEFQLAQNVNETRLKNLSDQLVSLGEKPEEGTEAIEISERRNQLINQIDRLMVPRIRALEAFKRADGLIGEIDIFLRAQKTDNLLQIEKTPLDFRIWPNAFAEFNERIGEMFIEVVDAWNTPAVKEQFRGKIVTIIGLFAVVIVLLTQGFKWIDRLSVTVKKRQDETSHGLATYLRSLMKVANIFLCLYLVLLAWQASQLYGTQTKYLAENILWSVLPIFGALWIALRIFPVDKGETSPIEVPSYLCKQAQVLTLVVGITLALWFINLDLQWMEPFGETTTTVSTFILSSILAGSSFWIGHILSKRPIQVTSEPEPAFKQVLQIRTGQLLMLISAISLILSIIGYRSASNALLFPSILSFGLVAGLILTFEAVRDFCAIIAEDSVSGHDGLVAVAINAALILGSVPLFALIWGARMANLTEVWTQFKSGVKLGDVQISPGALLALIVVFVIGYIITRVIQRTLKNKILPKTKMDTGGQNAIVSGFGYAGIFVAALIAITFAGIDLSSLAIVAGALSVGIGFGLQNIVSNFVSGIILLIERPISVGDWIEVGGNMGTVTNISVRSTSIQTFDKSDLIIPNADLIAGTVTNYTRGNSIGRVILPVGVAYGNDTRKISELLQSIVEGHPMVTKNPPPSVVFQGFGADSLNFEIRAVLSDINYGLSVKSELNHQITESFADNNIEIPFAQRDIWIRNPEALKKNS